jgi:hypothetical protein
LRPCARTTGGRDGRRARLARSATAGSDRAKARS